MPYIKYVLFYKKQWIIFTTTKSTCHVEMMDILKLINK